MRFCMLLLLAGLPCLGQDITISYDETSGSFSVVDPDAGRTWRSLPGPTCPDGIRVSHRIEGRELVVTLTANPEMKMSEFDFPRPFAAERGGRILLTQSYAVATVNFGDKPFVMGDGFKLAPGGHRMEKRK